MKKPKVKTKSRGRPKAKKTSGKRVSSSQKSNAVGRAEQGRGFGIGP